MKKTGFTLAEMLIVLVVLGVIGTLLISLVQFIIPDENEAKVKKAYNTIFQTVQYLTNDGDIYSTGLLNKYPSTVTDENAKKSYFCTHFADQLSTTGAIKCDSTTDITTQTVTFNNANPNDTMQKLDTQCDKRTTNFAFKTSDGVNWYGFRDDFSVTDPVDLTGGAIDKRYVVICVDPAPDDATVGPFGFGVRQDGKILVGKKAQDIIDKKGNE